MSTDQTNLEAVNGRRVLKADGRGGCGCGCCGTVIPCALLPFYLDAAGVQVQISAPQKQFVDSISYDGSAGDSDGHSHVVAVSGSQITTITYSAINGFFKNGGICGTTTIETVDTVAYAWRGAEGPGGGGPINQHPITRTGATTGTYTDSNGNTINASLPVYAGSGPTITNQQVSFSKVLWDAWHGLGYKAGLPLAVVTPDHLDRHWALGVQAISAGPWSSASPLWGKFATKYPLSLAAQDHYAQTQVLSPGGGLPPTGNTTISTSGNVTTTTITASNDLVTTVDTTVDTFYPKDPSGSATVYPYDAANNLAVYATFRPLGETDAIHDFTRFFWRVATGPTHLYDIVVSELPLGEKTVMQGGAAYVVDSCIKPFDCATQFDYTGANDNPALNDSASVPAYLYVLQEDVDNAPGASSAAPFAWLGLARITSTPLLTTPTTPSQKVVILNGESPPFCGTVVYAAQTKDYPLGSNSVTRVDGTIASVQVGPIVIQSSSGERRCSCVVATPCNPNFPSVWFQPVAGATVASDTVWNIPGALGGPYFTLSTYGSALPADQTSAPLSGGSAVSGNTCKAAQTITGTGCNGGRTRDFYWWPTPSAPNPPTGTFRWVEPSSSDPSTGDTLPGWTDCLTLGVPMAYTPATGPFGPPPDTRPDVAVLATASNAVTDCAACLLIKIVLTACDGTTQEFHARTTQPTIGSGWAVAWGTSVFSFSTLSFQGVVTAASPSGGNANTPQWDALDTTASAVASQTWSGTVAPCAGGASVTIATSAALTVGSAVFWSTPQPPPYAGAPIPPPLTGMGTVAASTLSACPSAVVSTVTVVGTCGTRPPLKITTTSSASAATSVYWLAPPANGGNYPAGIPMAGQWWRTDLYDPPYTYTSPTVPVPGGPVPFVEQVQTVEIQAQGFVVPSGSRMWSDPVFADVGYSVPTPILCVLDGAGTSAVATVRSDFDDIFAKQDALTAANKQLAADQAAGALPPVIAADNAAIIAAQLALTAAQTKYATDQSTAVSATGTQAAAGGLVKITATSGDGTQTFSFFTDTLNGGHVPAVNDVYLHPILLRTWNWQGLPGTMPSPNLFSRTPNPAGSTTRLYDASTTTTLANGIWTKIRNFAQWGWDGTPSVEFLAAQEANLDDSCAVTVTAVSAIGSGVNTDPVWQPIAGPYATLAATPYVRVDVRGGSGMALPSTSFFLDGTLGAVPAAGAGYKAKAALCGPFGLGDFYPTSNQPTSYPRTGYAGAGDNGFSPIGVVTAVTPGAGHKALPAWADSWELDRLFLSEAEACGTCAADTVPLCTDVLVNLVPDVSAPNQDPLYASDFYFDATGSQAPQVGDRYNLPAKTVTTVVTSSLSGTGSLPTVPATTTHTASPGFQPAFTAAYSQSVAYLSGSSGPWAGTQTMTVTWNFQPTKAIVYAVRYGAGKKATTSVPYLATKTVQPQTYPQRQAAIAYPSAIISSDSGLPIQPLLSETAWAPEYTVLVGYAHSQPNASTYTPDNLNQSGASFSFSGATPPDIQESIQVAAWTQGSYQATADCAIVRQVWRGRYDLAQTYTVSNPNTGNLETGLSWATYVAPSTVCVQSNGTI